MTSNTLEVGCRARTHSAFRARHRASADDETGDSDERCLVRSHASTSDASATFDVVLEELQILGVIGKGSSGIVQRAVHAPTGVSYAVKVIQMNARNSTRKRTATRDAPSCSAAT